MYGTGDLLFALIKILLIVYLQQNSALTTTFANLKVGTIYHRTEKTALVK